MYCAYPHSVYMNSVAKLWDFECAKHIAHTVNTALFHVSIRLFLVWSKVNVSKHFNIAYTHWHNVQHNFKRSRRHTKVTDVKEDRYTTARGFPASIEFCWKGKDFNFTPPYQPLIEQVYKWAHLYALVVSQGTMWSLRYSCTWRRVAWHRSVKAKQNMMPPTSG